METKNEYKMNNQINKAREQIKNADAILITAGAGMGVDSGLPDFRGNEGFWRAYPVIKKLGHSFVDMANPEWVGECGLLNLERNRIFPLF